MFISPGAILPTGEEYRQEEESEEQLSDVSASSCQRTSRLSKYRWTDPFAARALVWLFIDDDHNTRRRAEVSSTSQRSSRPALPSASYSEISKFLRWDEPPFGAVFVFGGRNGGPYDEDSFLSSVEFLDWHSLEWRAAPSLPEPRVGVGAAYISESRCFIVCGGYHFHGENNFDPSLMHTERLCADTMRWTRCADMLEQRSDHAVCALDGKVYAMGGSGSIHSFLSSCERYDTESDSWERIADLPVAVFAAKAVASGDGRSVILAGGLMQDGRMSSMQDRLAICGGWGEHTDLDTCEVFQDVSGSNLVCATLPDIPSGGRFGCQAVSLPAETGRLQGVHDPLLMILGGESCTNNHHARQRLFGKPLLLTQGLQWSDALVPSMLEPRTAFGVAVGAAYPRGYSYWGERSE